MNLAKLMTMFALHSKNTDAIVVQDEEGSVYYIDGLSLPMTGLTVLNVKKFQPNEKEAEA